MSKLGGLTAFTAEAALWVTGAALIAGAAGMHWNFDPQAEIGKLTGSQSSPAATAGPSHSPDGSLRPGASPTISPTVPKYMAFVAAPGFQVRVKFTNHMTSTLNGTTTEMDQNGTGSYKGGNSTDSHRETINGTVNTYDYINVGDTMYESKNSGAWAKSAMPASARAWARLIYAPTMMFVDQGVETKNGAQLHRLEVADAVAFSGTVIQTTQGATAAVMNYTVWVADDGTPVDFKVDGWVQTTLSGVSTKSTMVQEFRIIATSGVTITAPI